MTSANARARSEFAAIYILPAFLINVGNAAAYLFQLVLGRSMSAADFGTFNAAFALVLVATAPTGVAHLIVAHLAISRGDKADPALYRACLKFGAGAGLAVFIIGFALAALVTGSSAYEWATVLAAVATVAIAFLQPVPSGIIQSRGDHAMFAIVQGSITVCRLAGGVVLVTLLGLGVPGAMSAVAFSLVFALLLGLWLERGLLFAPGAPLPLLELGRDAVRFGWPQLLTALLVSGLTTLDVALVRTLDTPEAAGLYASASVIGRMGLLLPGALTGIIFVEAARNRAGLKLVVVTMALAFALAACVLLPVLIAPGWILGLLLGERYVGAAQLLQVTTAAMCCMAVAQAAMMHLLGRRTYGYTIILGAAFAGFLLAVYVLKPQALGMAWLLLIINALVLVGCALLAIAVARREGMALPGADR